MKDKKPEDDKESFEDRMTKIEKAVSDIAKSHENVIKSINDIAKSIEAKKAEGAPEGTMAAGSGEGQTVKLPESIDEKIHNQPQASAGESIKLDKAEMQDLKKQMTEIKEIVKSFKVENVSTGRPSNQVVDVTKSQDTDYALKVARGEIKANYGNVNRKALEVSKAEVAKLFEE
jgi:hypothetical protein